MILLDMNSSNDNNNNNNNFIDPFSLENVNKHKIKLKLRGCWLPKITRKLTRPGSQITKNKLQYQDRNNTHTELNYK